MYYISFIIGIELPKSPEKSHSYHLRTVWTIHSPITDHTVHEVVLMTITTTLIIPALILVILRIPVITFAPAQEVPLVTIVITIPITVITVITLVPVPVPVLIPTPTIPATLLNNRTCDWN